MSRLEDIRTRLDGHTLVRSVDAVDKGHVRIETAFLYPDGAHVDIFVPHDEPLFPPARLTDLGQTMSWLLDLQVRPWLSKKRQRLVEDALRLYDVEQQGGELIARLPGEDALMDGIVRLGQACVRVADIANTRRTSLQTGVSEEVEEVLADAEVDYEPNAELQGRFGAMVRVDFLVTGRRTRSALLTLASANTSQAHVIANEIFRKWYDLETPARSEQRVTVFDDRHDTYRTEDLDRLRGISDVVALSEKQTLQDLVAA